MKTLAIDQFERYYSEKLWEMIPPIYRHEDGKDENPNKDVLRSIVDVMAEQAAILRRSQDRLWDDQFVELCDSWAVPYIAALLGTRVLSDQNKRGRRIDVAKTIYYRRRSGTLRVLEEIISDITGWEGKIVENFKRLGRSRHGLDQPPYLHAGRLTGTMPGGWADIRRPGASEVSGSPFDEFFHTPDFRQHNGTQGLYNIPKLAIHLYRLKAFYISDSTPFSLGDDKRFTFDPSGRDVQLFSKRKRTEDWDEWHSALEWELPLPIRCRLLGHAEYLISESSIQALKENPNISDSAFNELSGLGVRKFKDEQQLRAMISSLPLLSSLIQVHPQVLSLLLQYFIIKDCGKQFLLPNALVTDENGIIEPQHGSICIELPSPGNIITSEQIIAANLINWSFTSPTQPLWAIDPGHGRFMFSQNSIENPICSYHYGFSGFVGAGTYDRRYIERTASSSTIHKKRGGILYHHELNIDGITQIDDSKTYSPVYNRSKIKNMTIQAANDQRPYLRLDKDWNLNTGGDLNTPENKDSLLLLDGLWIGSEANRDFGLILLGDYKCVTIRSCTFDPGGDTNARNDEITPVPLIIEGHVDTLIIESSIMGPLIVRDSGMVENVCIRNSIMQATNRAMNPAANKVIDINSGLVKIERSTILGEVSVHRLEASEVIFFCLPPYIVNSIAKISITDTQSGCFRFSAAPQGSLLPHPYESYIYTNSSENWYTSVRFGDPGYCQLSETASDRISRGAENGLEMGAFNRLINPVKLDDLKTKIEEYMPFGLIPIFINET